MAYMNVERKNELAPGIKKVLAEYGMKGTIAKDDYTLKVNLKSGPIDFGTDYVNAGRIGQIWRADSAVNVYHIDSHFTGVAKEFLLKLKDAMNVGNHNNSDITTDYFDVGWYIHINIGKWNKPYEVTA